MIPKGISQTSIPNLKKYTLEKDIKNAWDNLCSSKSGNIESPVLLKFHNYIWKYVVPYADS
jgi:hypothetical protein